jgi:membrane-associated PAP2 superfamily phosphatase
MVMVTIALAVMVTTMEKACSTMACSWQVGGEAMVVAVMVITSYGGLCPAHMHPARLTQIMMCLRRQHLVLVAIM